MLKCIIYDSFMGVVNTGGNVFGVQNLPCTLDVPDGQHCSRHTAAPTHSTNTSNSRTDKTDEMKPRFIHSVFNDVLSNTEAKQATSRARFWENCHGLSQSAVEEFYVFVKAGYAEQAPDMLVSALLKIRNKACGSISTVKDTEQGMW
jgi:hypothetical protein